LKSGLKPSWLHNTCTSASGCQHLSPAWAVARFPRTTTLVASECLGSWAWWKESWENNFLDGSVWVGCLCYTLLKEKSFKWVYTFTLTLKWVWFCCFLRYPQDVFPVVLAEYLASFYTWS
jgi:hypothetical protein